MNNEVNGLLEKIHSDAIQVLEEVGVKCESKKIRHIFEDTGLAAFDETTGHIHILAPLVEQALNTAPKRDQYWIPENSFGVGLALVVFNLLQVVFTHPDRVTDNAVCRVLRFSRYHHFI